MINIRYHIITLVAVFLALAVGIVAGSTVIQQSLVNNLEDNLDRVEQTLQDLESKNRDLSNDVEQLRSREKALSDQGPAPLLADRLDGTTVLVLGVDGIDEGAIGSLRSTLTTAGASTAGTAWFTERLALTDGDAVRDLAELLGVTTQSPAALQAELAQRLGDLLTVAGAPAAVLEGSSTTRPVSDQTAAAAAARLLTLLDELRQARFVDLDGGLSATDPADLVGMRLVVAGGEGAKLEDDALMLPLLDRLGQDVDPMLVAVEAGATDPTLPRGSFVGVVRGDRRLRDRMSTVDDAEGFAGWAATVLALADLQRGKVGHYGVGQGAERLLPAVASS